MQSMSFTLHKVAEEHKPVIPDNSIVAFYVEAPDPRLPNHTADIFGRHLVRIGKARHPTPLTHNNGTLTTISTEPVTVGTLKIVQESHKWYQLYLVPPAPHEHLITPIIQTLVFPSTNPEDCDHALTEDYKRRVTENRLRYWNSTYWELKEAGADPTILNQAETLITNGVWKPGTREKVTNLINEACNAGLNTINNQYTTATEALHQKGLI